VSAEAQTITFSNAGDLNVTHAVAERGVLLASTNGSVTVGDGASGTDPAFGGSFTALGKTFVTFNGTVTALDGTIIGNAPTINVNGKLHGKFVSLLSSKLTVGNAAELGQVGLTTQLAITNNGGGPSTIGGPGGGPGYVISEADLQKMHGASILLSMPAAGLPGTPDVTVKDFAVDATTMFGSGDGRLTIDPPGSIAVTGAVKITNANPGTILDFDATDSITVVTDTGSIKLIDAANLPGGKLSLNADHIAVASASAITDLASTTTTQQREDRLAQSDNPSNEGAIVAGAMDVLVKTAFYIQNSGTGAKSQLNKRRGFTVGTGGLTITNQDFPLEMIINGRQVKTATTFYLGDSLIPKITFVTPTEGVFNYNQLSSVNGCVVVNAPCTVTSGISLPPIQDVVNIVANNDPPTGDQTGQGPIQAINLPLIQFASSTPYSFSPPIDEPVTGAGNQDLWTGSSRCANGDQCQ
jgi:hypothetical protein